MSVTIADLAEYRLGRPAETGGDYEDAELPMMGGCQQCEASIAAYNACPSRTGYLRCEACIGDTGWVSVEACNQDVFGEVKGA